MAGTFWGNQNADPKRKFRWLVEFTGGGQQGDGNTIQLAAKTIKKPSFEIVSTPHKFINHTFYFPGRVEWKEINATLVDVGGDRDVTTILTSVFLRSGYVVPDELRACEFAIAKDLSVDAFGANFLIKQIGPEAEIIEEWKLINPWLRMVEFGDLDYGSEDLVEINLTIVYDYAIKTV
jgi:hypothetical protein